MKNKCRKCGDTLAVPSWTTCQKCDSPLPKTPKPKRRENPYMAKYQNDGETLEELHRRHPAGKSRNKHDNSK